MRKVGKDTHLEHLICTYSAILAVMNPLLAFDTSVWNVMLAKKSTCAKDAIATTLSRMVSWML